ncbi:MAG: DUF5103 domain-containing protein [Cyclobacteriaceae bacterium]|nr:DUF5103 domain-containing protein [Cyclobacteriaceae bacterium]MDH4297293.1 DUF5103 domain-containing protein [Cyclobacteriaceae bacterium]MDH5247800.1 DUF5103 domain-containing protein [Cyclobacteriaceae bacterium]
MKSSYLILVCIGIASCTPLPQSSLNSDGNPKVLMLKDFAYEPQIRTIQLSPDGSPMAPAVTRLGEWNLLLQFDDLRSDRDTYYARVLHCNYDWTRSSLQDLDYMSIYNEFPINNTEYSIDTHIPYVHYWMPLPPVKLPGNYVLVVYRGTNKDDIVLSRRFIVYETLLSFTNDGNLIGPGSIANINQQLNFTINYNNVNIVNPMLDVHVSIRQNQRWDNMSNDVRPSFVREIEKELEYRFFDETKMFRGGNEFRFFDLRSLNNPGRNVDYVAKAQKPYEVFIAKDKTREGESYSQYNDLNGAFIIDNYDYRDLAFTNYAYVTFSLETPPVDGDVYVTGGFSYWNLANENKMSYDSVQGLYTSRILLKQGWYDYQYLVKSQKVPPYHFEGSHFETENYYEIFVYNRPFQPQADLLIGYLRLEKNPR